MKYYLTEEEKKKIRNLGVKVAYFLNISPLSVRKLIKNKYLKSKTLKNP